MRVIIRFFVICSNGIFYVLLNVIYVENNIIGLIIGVVSMKVILVWSGIFFVSKLWMIGIMLYL